MVLEALMEITLTFHVYSKSFSVITMVEERNKNKMYCSAQGLSSQASVNQLELRVLMEMSKPVD